MASRVEIGGEGGAGRRVRASPRGRARGRLPRALVLGYRRDHVVLVANLSRLTNLLILLNISLFFLTQLVTRQHYFYTIYSVSLLALVHVGLILPTGLLGRVGYYLTLVALEAAGAWFLVASVWYWIETSRAPIYLF